MRKCKKILIIILSVVVGLPVAMLLIIFIAGIIMYHTADFLPPETDIDLSNYALTVESDSLIRCDDGSLYINKYGLIETRITGTPAERGVIYGLMNRDLLKYQEDVFVNQIHEIIPSEWWVKFLHKVIIIFNKDMAEHIPQEFRKEIYAMSLSCTDEYDAYGSTYVRQLNYHAAHDIGHAMQQYMLVGCSSFAAWDDASEDGNLIVGRNFDFYVGDDFAKNKVVLIMEPDEGYKFISISWPGMMGVLSGMNEEGLTVTINAAKGAIPTSSAIPISLLTRQILQYASTIEEAFAIAQEYETFVSESILIASAKDGYAAIIEKTPKQISLFEEDKNVTKIVCTNHYQSEMFEDDEYNKVNIANSDSPYRHKRLNELLDEKSPLTPDDSVDILRNRYGLGNSDIGLGNEKSLNQFIAHHSVVFKPNDLKMWVSTSPWQLGEYVCYDLDEIFDKDINNHHYYASEEYNISADSLSIKNEYEKVCHYREDYKEVTKAIKEKRMLSQDFIEGFIADNPNYFQVYNILGDYMLSKNEIDLAKEYWKKSLMLEIARVEERDEIIKKVEKYD